MSEIVTRQQAKELGLRKFFTGFVCNHNHLSQRWSHTGRCVECTHLKTISDNKKRPVSGIKKQNKFGIPSSEYSEVYSKEYYQKNRERLKEKSRRFHAEHRQDRNEKHEIYRKKNLDKYVGYTRKRRGIKRLVGGHHTDEDINNILKNQNYKCAYCRKSVKKAKHIDHIISLAKGGDNSKKNLQACCPACNIKKRDKDPVIFAREMGFLI